jgi:1-deoxy-D-xylulose-5-phosphate reductoisomerase
VAVLGSTGSVGRQALDVIERLPERFRVVALCAGSDATTLAAQVRRHRPALAALRDPAGRDVLEAAGRETGCDIVTGPDAAAAAAAHAEADVVLAAIVGAAGLQSTWEALRRGRVVALANKESLVLAGSLLEGALRRHGGSLVPVDSEHSAVHQCLRGERIEDVSRLVLTASGGPFRTRPLETFDTVKPGEALRHPVWDMGPKISVDSATLMNKGLEVIEARWLFGLPEERIEVILHPQGVVHSMVEMKDGSILGQMGVADMRVPILYALSYPERATASLPRFDFTSKRTLEFEPVEAKRFPCLGLARQALRAGGSAPVALNAANEVAVEAFLAGRLPFPGIARLVSEALERHTVAPMASLEDVLENDRTARRRAKELLSMQVPA